MYNLKNELMAVSFDLAQTFGANCEIVGFFIDGKSLSYDRTINGIYLDLSQPCFAMGDGKHYMLPITDCNGGHFYKEFVAFEPEKIFPKNRIVFCNFPYVSGYGSFRHTEISEDEAKKLVSEFEDNWLSAIGHEATANVLSELFGIEINVNRIEYKYQSGDIQLILKLNKRQPEGSVLNRKTLDEVGFTFSTISAI